ncbi:MAG: RAMP superfamily CRISPR-associated protein [Mediterraneibacter sp.]
MGGRKYELVITLKSDLCAGSGYSYAGIVDSDVCYDSYGFPYIAARRLKGCLREAAELIGVTKEEIGKIFGQGGEEKVSGIYIDNAYIENYEELRRDCEKLDKQYCKYITRQNILSQFTSVKAQTKIEKSGTAKDNSLRFTRTVNHYSPLDPKKEMCFRAQVEMPEERERDEAEREKNLEETVDKLKKIAKALRNIGMNRNRGLGSVKCSLEGPVVEKRQDSEDGKNTDSGRPDLENIEISVDEKEYILRYSVRNISPLILSTTNDFKTEKYISGRSVLGFFAGAYLRSAGKSADSEDFKNIFLRNQVKFGALYPAEIIRDDESRIVRKDIYYPAPAYISQLKKTKKYVNVTKEIPEKERECEDLGLDPSYASENGNRPRRLKGKFVSIREESDGKNVIMVKEPETDIVYHHTKKSKKQNAADGNLLYTSEVLREQQIFAGEIRGEGKYIKEIVNLLKGNTLRFGKSKSAQYGTCVLEGGLEVVCAEEEKKTHTYKKGSLILAVLESDAVFVNLNGYTVRCDEVREQIRKSLKIEEKEVPSEADDEKAQPYSEIKAGILTGYYGKWNLHRPSVPVVKAGSTFEFALAQDLVTDEDVLWTGENNGEGFGRLRIIRNGIYSSSSNKDDSNKNGLNCCIAEAKKEKSNSKRQKKPETAAELFRKIIIDEAREVLLRRAVNTDLQKQQLQFDNPAALGRIMLMLAESMDKRVEDLEALKKELKEPEDKTEEAAEYMGVLRYVDFIKRIDSIKKKSLKDKAADIVSKYICKIEKLEETKRDPKEPDRDFDISATAEDFTGGSLEYLKDVAELERAYVFFGQSESAFKKEMAGLWSEYLMAILVQERYNLKHREDSHENS